MAIRKFSRLPVTSAVLSLLVITAMNRPSRGEVVLSETFDNDPVAAGRAILEGSASRFMFDAGQLTAHYDTLQPTAKLLWPLGQSFNENTDFRFDVTLTIPSAGFFADPDKFGQISFGLLNGATTGTDRSGGSAGATKAFDVVTVDYFPNISPVFGGPTLAPTVIQSDNGTGFFNRVLFAAGAETLLDDPGEADLPRDVTLTTSMVYLAATRSLTMQVAGPGGYLPINQGGDVLGELGGPDGDPSTIQLILPPTAFFSVDHFGLTLWQDAFTGTASSVVADLRFDSFTVSNVAVPEPGALSLVIGGLAVGAPWYLSVQFRRRRAK